MQALKHQETTYHSQASRDDGIPAGKSNAVVMEVFCQGRKLKDPPKAPSEGGGGRAGERWLCNSCCQAGLSGLVSTLGHSHTCTHQLGLQLYCKRRDSTLCDHA